MEDLLFKLVHRELRAPLGAFLYADPGGTLYNIVQTDMVFRGISGCFWRRVISWAGKAEKIGQNGVYLQHKVLEVWIDDLSSLMQMFS